MIERLWVEVNTRVNYPVKKVLIEMENAGDINMGDDLHKYCVSWFSKYLRLEETCLFSHGIAIPFQVIINYVTYT